MTLGQQITWLFVLAIPVACIAWTITHEEVFREPREYCLRCSQQRKSLLARKFFYLLTCEYCLSHYVTIFFLTITGYKLLYTDWRGYLISGFSIVWIANLYINLFGLFRQDIKKERAEAQLKQKELTEKEDANKIFF